MNRQLRTQPGLIDLQVNGYAGHDVNADDVDVETLADLTHALWAQGVTTYLPTVITASEEKITHVLAVIAAARRSDPLLAHSIAGIHVEGTSLAAATARGARISLGHCTPAPEQVRSAVAAGATLSTHLGNGTHAQLPRHPNHLWSQLAEDRLTAMLIADGHPLPAETLTVMIRAKTPGRCVLTSDSAALAGSAPGLYSTPVGGSVEVRDDGSLRLPG